jgi:Holliday junction resolvasome RuvABC ATP-dependent DNA helicase subunit
VVREDSTLRILDEISDTMNTLAEMNKTIGMDTVPAPSGMALDQELKIDEKSLGFLFHEAKKINKTIADLIGQTGEADFMNTLANDIIIISSLCSMADKKMSAEELIFISLVLLPLDPGGSGTTRKLSDKIFAGDAFPLKHKGDLFDYWNSISGYIRKLKPDIDLEGFSLKTMNLVENLDRENGTRLADRAGSALYTIAQCIMKADGPPSAAEEERLRQIYRLVNRGTNTSSSAVSVMEAEEEETLDTVMEKINALVGMGKIKDQIATLVNLIKVQKEREERKLPATPLSLHSVFYGPPGTGKTTIARLLGKVYKCLGLLKRGQLVETDRAGLVAGYVGQTAINVDNVVQKALDGVLFIDEAYALIPDDIGGRDFGQEAVNTILKRMEDYRDRLVVIVAGYTDEMNRFILSNPGLQSRFSRYLYFDHYKPEELLQIFDTFCKNAEFIVGKEARDRAASLFSALYEKRDRTFGTGRMVRNTFERIVERQANRIAGLSPLTDEILCTITAQDIPEEKDLVG